MHTSRAIVAAALAAILSAPAGAFDKVLLKDGRMVEGKVLKEAAPGEAAGDVTRLRIGKVEIPIANALIDKTWIEDLEGYVPKNKQEEDYLKKGLVLFEGSWMSRTRRETELKKRADAEKLAIAESLKRQDWRNAVTEESRHFIVTSNCTDAVRKEYVSRLEAYHKYFTDAWSITLSPGEVRGKMKVMLYRDYRDFLRVTKVPVGVLGFFSFVDQELQLFHDAEDPDSSLDTLFHEGNHLLTFLIDTGFRYPIWLNEGMAEYYGTAWIDERGEFHVGELQHGRIVELRTAKAAGKSLRLREVLETEQPQFGSAHYAVAWSFVHYMMESPRHGKAFKGFFATLPRNRDLKTEHKTYSNIKGSLREPTLDDVIAVLEDRFGASVEELEAEWLGWIEQAYGELKPQAYFDAAMLTLRNPQPDGSHLTMARDYFEKAVGMGIERAACYRNYSELLRQGGTGDPDEAGALEPDPVRAWDMVQKAMTLDPVGPYNYVEAAAVLLMPSPVQDLDRAKSMCDTALALAGKGDWFISAMAKGLLAAIEPAREALREAAEAAAEEAATDRRLWYVGFFYIEGQPEPEQLRDLGTAELRELIRGGKVKGEDKVFQAWRDADPETGEPVEGSEPWDKGWVAVKDCPLFAAELAEAQAASGG